MRRLSSTFIMLMFLAILAGCQAKGEGSDSLVSDHKPTTNSFSLVTPTSKTYVAGETITLKVTFPFDLIVDTTGGNPVLNIKIGNDNRVATYSPGSDPRVLTFNYTVAALENAPSGITVSSLSLNGSTIQFDNKGTLENCNVGSLKSKTFSNVKVDTQGPRIIDFKLTSTPGFYNKDELIHFAVVYDEEVYVAGGVPYFETTLNSAVQTKYVSGSGTKTLQFSFKVESTHSDTDGFDINPLILLNGATMKDKNGNNAELDLSNFEEDVEDDSELLLVGGQFPYVTNVTLPENKTYYAGDSLEIILHFDQNISITGSPYLNLTIGANTRQAQYISKVGQDALLFRYTVVPGDVALTGITVPSTITRNSSNITNGGGYNYFTNTNNNTFVVPPTTGIIVNAVQPMAISVTRNTDITLPIFGGTVADNVWIIGQVLTITVGFNTPVYVTQTNGVPSISMTIGSTTREAIYSSGGNGQTNLTFNYTIQEGDLDTDNSIALNGIILNGGVITDDRNTNVLLTLPVASLANTKVDGVRPTIVDLTLPANGVYSTNTSPNNLAIKINWSENVRLSATGSNAGYLNVDIGGTVVRAQYSAGNNSSTTTHTYNIASGVNDADGIEIQSPYAGSALVRDAAGNSANVFTFTPPNSSQIIVDTKAPTVTSIIQLTPDGNYTLGDDIEFEVTFDEPVTTLVAGAYPNTYPRIPMTLGSGTVYLSPTANKTDTTHVFRYTVRNNDLSTGVITGTSITHNGTTAYARDEARNNSGGTFTAANAPGINIDARAPTVQSRAVSPNKTYVSGETLQISITYNEPVEVDTDNGTPYIAVDFAAGTDNFEYSSGSGTATLVFSRTLDGDHFDMDGLNSSVNSITLNGGTIKDLFGNNAPTTFTALNLSSIFVTYPGVKIWAQTNFTNRAPTPTAATISNTGAVTTGTCGNSNCRIFDGNDALNLTGTLTGVTHVFMAFQAPGSFGSDKDIFAGEIILKDETTNYDIVTPSGASITLNGSPGSGPTQHGVSISLNSMQILHVQFSATQNFGAEILIPNTFNGRMGDVIAVEGALNSTQISNILNYLNSKY